MGNHTYIISERLFHKEKNEKTRTFLEGTDIDPDDELHSEPLSIEKIKNILPQLGYVLEKGEILNSKKDEWQCLIHKNGELKVRLIISGFTDFETEVGMIQVGRESDERSAIEIFLALTPSCGKFLYYCDSGIMASISPGKTVEKIYQEFNDR